MRNLKQRLTNRLQKTKQDAMQLLEENEKGEKYDKPEEVLQLVEQFSKRNQEIPTLLLGLTLKTHHMIAVATMNEYKVAWVQLSAQDVANITDTVVKLMKTRRN